MNDNKFWIICWILIAITIISVTGIISIYSIKVNEQILQVDDSNCLKMAFINSELSSTYQSCILSELAKSASKK